MQNLDIQAKAQSARPMQSLPGQDGGPPVVLLAGAGRRSHAVGPLHPGGRLRDEPKQTRAARNHREALLGSGAAGCPCRQRDALVLRRLPGLMNDTAPPPSPRPILSVKTPSRRGLRLL